MSTKSKLLESLKKEKGNWVSGEALSNRLMITRSAIWKHIKRLRDEGYKIESSPKKGYFFRESSPNLLPDEIRARLGTEKFGRKEIIYFKETDSTNLRAKELANKGAPEGTIIISEHQTKGRGRKGRDWFSPEKGGIYMSIILRPNIPPNEAPKITLLTGVALAEALMSLVTLPVNIKWPNDILINNKKIAGILTEISTEMDKIDFVIVGTGINVNTEHFPFDLKDKATSLYMASSKYFNRISIITDFLKWYEDYYETFKRTGFDFVMKRWMELADILGRQVKIEMIDQTIQGIVEDVDEQGALIVKKKDGTVHTVFSGDVILR